MSSSTNIRIERTNSDIYRIIASFTAERGIAAEVVDVKTSADLSEAKVSVTAELETFEKAAGFLRSEIARRLNLRNTPRIKFVKDIGRENAARVEELLNEIKEKSARSAEEIASSAFASQNAPRNDKETKK